ncbi:MAG TPA: MBL fold metallo-hydrolase [Thermoanaerobaculia bacterium]|nr:MBL fold metallo-hydrolase [Thermoanaerobaculia bacterium]
MPANTPAAALLLVAFSAIASASAPPPGTVDVARGVILVPGSFVPGQQPDGNTIIFRGKRRLLVVDTGRHESHTRKIVDLARALGRPVTTIVNTHWHLDHIGGNALLRREYPSVKIYASSAFAEAREGFLKRYHAQLQDALKNESNPAQKETFEIDLHLIERADALAPDVIIRTSHSVRFPGRSIDVNLESYAVTAGDLWLYDRASRVLVSGDLVTLPVPFFDTACPARWSAALDDLAKVRFSILIPGHGDPMSRPAFETYRKSFRDLTACAASSEPKQTCIDGWMKDAASLIAKDDPKFVRSMLDYYVGNVLRGDANKMRELCGDATRKG